MKIRNREAANVDRTCPKTPVLVVAPKGDVFCPKAGADCPKGEGEVVPKGLELAPKPAKLRIE